MTENNETKLNQKQSAAFAKTLLETAEPNEVLKAAAKRHRKLVRQEDAPATTDKARAALGRGDSSIEKSTRKDK